MLADFSGLRTWTVDVDGVVGVDRGCRSNGRRKDRLQPVIQRKDAQLLGLRSVSRGRRAEMVDRNHPAGQESVRATCLDGKSIARSPFYYACTCETPAGEPAH